ncbi:MAG: YitT family protein [Eubacteriales bacterium]|nr:YitT family protein [Eubacteriales bacterium]
MSLFSHPTKKTVLSVCMILFGNALYALAVVCFLLPSGIITGGTTGLALAAHRALHIPISSFVLAFNLAMFVLGAVVLGKAFALTTLLSTFFYPIALAFWQRFPALSSLTEDSMLCTVLGGMMIGAGIGIVIRAGASTGGMDIPPLILKKKWNLPVSATLYVFDFCILLLQMFFTDTEEILYGLLLVLIYTFVLDKVLVIGQHQARVDIVSSHWEQIRQAILLRLDRGCTLLEATTGYLQTEQPVLMTVVSRREMVALNKLVMDIDPGAFLIISDANEVRGPGFTQQKIHRQRP